MAEISLLIIDDRPLVGDLLRHLCADDIVAVQGVVTSVDAALEHCRRGTVTVAVMSGGIVDDRLTDVIPNFLACGVRVLALCAEDAALPAQLLLAGAAGLLPSADTSADELRRALRTVAKGHAALHPAAALAVLHRWRAQQSPVHSQRPAALTARELEILDGMSEGLTTRMIATRLRLSAKTVEAHRSRIFSKLGAKNQAQAISLARSRLDVPKHAEIGGSP